MTGGAKLFIVVLMLLLLGAGAILLTLSFFLLSGLSLFALRQRDPDIERPFRVPLFPLVLPGVGVSPGANTCSFAKAPATTVIPGLVLLPMAGRDR